MFSIYYQKEKIDVLGHFCWCEFHLFSPKWWEIRFLTLKMGGRLIHEVDLYTSKYGISINKVSNTHPKTLILVSKTETTTSLSNETSLMTSLTAFSNSFTSPRTLKVKMQTNKIYRTHYYMATIVRPLWLAAEWALFSCNDRALWNFSRLFWVASKSN